MFTQKLSYVVAIVTLVGMNSLHAAALAETNNEVQKVTIGVKNLFGHIEVVELSHEILASMPGNNQAEKIKNTILKKWLGDDYESKNRRVDILFRSGHLFSDDELNSPEALKILGGEKTHSIEIISGGKKHSVGMLGIMLGFINQDIFEKTDELNKSEIEALAKKIMKDDELEKGAKISKLQELYWKHWHIMYYGNGEEFKS